MRLRFLFSASALAFVFATAEAVPPHASHPIAHAPPVQRAPSRPPIAPRSSPPIYRPVAPHPPIARRPSPPPVARPVVPAPRPGVIHPNIDINRNRNISNWQSAHAGNWNRPAFSYHPYYSYHAGWYHGGWGWYRRPSYWIGGAGAFAAGWLFGASSGAFYNPYYVAVPLGPSVVYDYSQPIFMPPQPSVIDQPNIYTAPADVQPALPLPSDVPAISNKPVDDPKAAQAAPLFDAARNAFRQGNYDAAMASVDQAIKVNPTDPVLHEFRSLVFFAEHKYREATGVIYSVLAVGPGWDWPTMKALYPDTATYDQQLRALQQFVASNPSDPASRFLLAYHCLVLDQKPEAVRLLKQVVALNPQDKLAAELIKNLDQPAGAPDDRPRVNP